MDLASVELATEWGDVSGVPVQYSNQYAASLGLPTADGHPDGIYLTFGHLQIPLITGGEAEIRRLLEERGSKVIVAPQARFILSRARLGELIGLLNKIAEQYDRVSGTSGEE